MPVLCNFNPTIIVGIAKHPKKTKTGMTVEVKLTPEWRDKVKGSVFRIGGTANVSAGVARKVVIEEVGMISKERDVYEEQ